MSDTKIDMNQPEVIDPSEIDPILPDPSDNQPAPEKETQPEGEPETEDGPKAHKEAAKRRVQLREAEARIEELEQLISQGKRSVLAAVDSEVVRNPLVLVDQIGVDINELVNDDMTINIGVLTEKAQVIVSALGPQTMRRPIDPSQGASRDHNSGGLSSAFSSY